MTAAIARRHVPAEGDAPELELLEVGPAPRFLLLHGSSGRAALWQPLMQALAARGAGSLALSLRGHGGSGGAARPQDFGIADYVADVHRVLATLPAPPVLVGHSMGGLVAQRAAAGRPLPGLALLAASPVGGMRRDGLRMALRQPRAFLRAARRRSFLALYEEPEAARWLLFAPATPLATVAAFSATLTEESWKAGSEMNTLLPDPRAVTCPVLVVGATEDRMVAPASVRRTARAYGVEPAWLAGRGHMLQVEGDADELAALLLRGPWARQPGDATG